MIESGSLTLGIDPAAWRIPAGTAVRYEIPADGLRPMFRSYAVLDSDPTVWKGPGNWMLPCAAQIWVVLADAPVTVSMRRRPPVPLGSAVVLGPTSQAMPVGSHGGVSIVIDVSPIGWARLFGATAEGARDQIRPLSLDWAETLIATLHASDRSTQVKPLLDALLADHLPLPSVDESLVARAMAALSDADTVEDAAAAAGITPRALLRLCNRYSGFGPKLLMRRIRFLDALTAMLMQDAVPDFSTPPPGYHDVPHFLRDANLFLGLTPRRFLTMPMPYLRAVLRARMDVLGAPMPVLDGVALAGR